MASTKPVVGVAVDHTQSLCIYPSIKPKGDAYINSLGLPMGITSEFKKTMSGFPSRTWIIDNSGSMATSDGHRLINSGSKMTMISSTRWEELSDTLLWHGTLAAHMEAPTEFRLLNPPNGGPQVISCGNGDAELEVAALKRMVSTSPSGRTPLCEHIRQVTATVARHADALRQSGQRHVVIIASDGQSTDGDVAQAMRALQNLPVWIVVRLCTDDDKVVNYWNQIDEELELDLDVLDDLSGEAKEVSELSPWLTYGEPLHRLREWGCMCKVFDLLDEKKLSTSEMRELLVMLLGEEDLPHPEADFAGFTKAATNALTKLPLVYDPIRNRRVPWIDMGKLSRLYDPEPCCIIS